MMILMLTIGFLVLKMINFEKVKFRQLQSLLIVLLRTKSRDLNYIESVYRKNAENFQETIKFFESLNLIILKQGDLVCSQALISFLENIIDKNNEELEEMTKIFIFKNITEENNDLAYEFFGYIGKYEISGDEFVFRPTKRENIKYSGIRNLLMELDIVIFQKEENKYILVKKPEDYLYQDKTHLSPALLKKIKQYQEELGEHAELIVLEEEKKRLSGFPELQSQIKHVSKFTVNAGYDIESFEGIFTIEGEPIKRYIEVKAIKLDSPRFFWSNNEIQKAKGLGGIYWLYLVPFKNKNEFEMSLIEKISDPYNALFIKNDEWNSQVELISFTKIKIKA